MALTVRRLISALKKMPQDAKVVIADHDHNDDIGEFNGPIPGPSFIWRASRAIRQRGYDVVIHL